MPYSIASDTSGANNDIDFTVCIADLDTMPGKTDGGADHVYAFTPTVSGKYEARLSLGTGSNIWRTS